MTKGNHVDTARRHLGELGAMSEQTQRVEREILSRAEKQLAEIESHVDAARGSASGDDEAATKYTDMIAERGRLTLVIANARKALT